MKMKKLIAMLMVVGMAVAMLSACGGSKEEEAKKIESADDLEGAKIGVQTGTTGDIYVTDAKNYVTPGTLYCFSPDGVLKWSARTGDIPAHFAFVRR